jgi:YidC/Oxa1 family membrane protein insertase
MLNENGSGGDKRTLVAVVLSVVVITVGFLLQSVLFPIKPDASQAAAHQAPAASATNSAPASTAAPGPASSSIVAAGGVANQSAATKSADTALLLPKAAMLDTASSAAVPIAEQRYTIKTDLLEAVLSNKGGDLVSLKLKKHADRDGMVDLVVPKADGSGGLSLSLGAAGSAPVSDLMNASFLDDHTIAFTRTYLATVPGKDAPVPFTLRKTYTFRNGDYMFGMAVELENSINEYLPLDTSGIAYTLSLGPQIGPRLSNQPGGSGADVRRFVQYVGGKKKDENPKVGTSLVLKDQPTWVGLSGKYFTLLAVPQMASFKTTFLKAQDPTLFETDTIAISRPSIKASKQTDAYYFYFGPKTNGELAKYDYADKNAFGLSGLNFERAADTSGILSWLEWLLKGALNIFYWMLPNYGVAIIFLTILVKALLFPLTKNGAIASARMQELQPQMQELQAKYKNNPQKLNQEMAEFYKREGYNPMSGCLPLLIQMPIFFAMYNLFNNHFDLRGALFIPGWIPDLSQPEAIFRFADLNFLFLHVNAIRALPIIYLVSQLLYGKYTQAATPQTGQNAMQMKMMMYWMPIIFFFILYDTPSGLLVYWIVSNVLSIGQQIVINDIVKKRKLAIVTTTASSGGGKASSGPVLAPGRGNAKNASGNKIVKGEFGKGGGKKKK